MANKKLSQKEIAKRLVRLRNLEKLHSLSKQMRSKKDEFIQLQAEQIEKLQELANHQQALLETQAIRIAELEAMVFGKKKRPPMGGTPIGVPDPFSPVPVPRGKDSYRRPLPPASAVTSEVTVPLPTACACGGSFDLASVTVHERYEEDIPLPELTPNYQAHLVTKYVIERGKCTNCGKRTSGRDLGGAQVALGPNVRLLVCHLIAVVGLSYAQAAGLLLALYGFSVTDGELANMLHSQHIVWTPSYNQLQANIRAAPVVHADETPWPIQDLQGLGYAWLLADVSSPRVCFALKQSRGAVHAQTLFGTQQLCWAHLYRTIRDLRYNPNLPEEQLPYVEDWYAGFAGIYQDLRQYLGEPYDQVVRETQVTELWQRIQQLANKPTPNCGEPDKLSRLKAQLQRAGQDRLLACLPKDTPCDNNRAERDLRQLVLKRKRSFGSKSERGAQALATILSLCTTAWRTAQPKNYFSALASLT